MCRAYLTPWMDPETGKYVTIGRCNIGAVSLNIPVIIEYCKQTYPSNWKEKFWDELSDRLQVIREFFWKRYDTIREVKACTNPMSFTQGGLYKGNLQPDQCVGDLVKYMTASFGITALHESTILWNGHRLIDDKSFANEVIDFINEKITKFKQEDGYLYALYGTPAESLCQTQATQYREYSKDDQFGSFFTNSFHMHVNEHITPFEKQNAEDELFHKVNGKHIC